MIFMAGLQTSVKKSGKRDAVLAKQFMELLDVKLENDGPLSVSEQQDIPE